MRSSTRPLSMTIEQMIKQWAREHICRKSEYCRPSGKPCIFATNSDEDICPIVEERRKNGKVE